MNVNYSSEEFETQFTYSGDDLGASAQKIRPVSVSGLLQPSVYLCVCTIMHCLKTVKITQKSL